MIYLITTLENHLTLIKPMDLVIKNIKKSWLSNMRYNINLKTSSQDTFCSYLLAGCSSPIQRNILGTYICEGTPTNSSCNLLRTKQYKTRNEESYLFLCLAVGGLEVLCRPHGGDSQSSACLCPWACTTVPGKGGFLM